MELIRKSNEVAAIMGEIENDRIEVREANKRKKEADQAAKAARKKLQQEKQKENKNKARETCEKTMELLGGKGTVHIQKLTVPVMKDLLRFVFCSEDYKRTDLRKPALIALVTSKYEDYLKGNIATVAPQPENNIEQILDDDEIVLSDYEVEEDV